MNNIARAKQLFARNKEQNEVHFTSDGYAFYEKEKATSHASRLDDREIETVTREQAEAYKEKANEKEAEEGGKTEAKGGKKGKGGKPAKEVNPGGGNTSEETLENMQKVAEEQAQTPDEDKAKVVTGPVDKGE